MFKTSELNQPHVTPDDKFPNFELTVSIKHYLFKQQK